MPQAVEEQSTESEAKCPSDPYEQFLAAQKKRSLEWKAEREAKRAKAQSVVPTVKQPEASSIDRDHRQEDLVTPLRQQLANKTEECRELRNRLESIEAVNTRILKNQMEMQENLLIVSLYMSN